MKRIIAINFFMMFQLSVLVFAFEEKNPKDASIEKIEKTISEALKDFENKKETYIKEVLDLFEKKEMSVRNKGDLTLLNQIKKEKDAFISQNKEPTLFFITDQKRFMEKAKIELIKNYEIAIKESIKLKLDFEAEELTKDLEAFKTGKIRSKSIPPTISKEINETPRDLFQKGSIWAGGWVLEVISRKNNSFSALFYTSNKSHIREIVGTINSNKIYWSNKDTKVKFGDLVDPGRRHFGIISKDSIQFETFTAANKKLDNFELKLIFPSKAIDSLIGRYKFVKGTDQSWRFLNISKDNQEPLVELSKDNINWRRFIDWGLSENVLLLRASGGNLNTIEKKQNNQINYSGFINECKKGFTKTYLPSRPPDMWAVFEKID